MSSNGDVALLAPVPLRHLQSGLEVCAAESKVAFGSMAFEVFSELEGLRGGRPVPIYFYASHMDDPLAQSPDMLLGPPVISWRGTYTGFSESDLGKYAGGNRFRPPTTYLPPRPDSDDWGVFWEVTGLEYIEPGLGRLQVSSLKPFGSNKRLASVFIPRGPLLIQSPL